MKKLLSALAILVTITYADAQTLPDQFTINIKATTTTPVNQFLVDVIKQNDKVKLVYSLRDSVSYKLNLDQKYHALNDLVVASFATASRDSLAKLTAKQDSFRTYYSIYSKDSISFSVDEIPAYLAVLQQVNKTTNVVLANASANAARNQREGPLFEIKITSPKETRVVYAQYPTTSTNPLLYQLISESLKLYRDKKQNGFLDKRRTNNY